MADSPKSSITSAPEVPGDIQVPDIILDKDKREAIGTELQTHIQEAQGERAVLDAQLVRWNNLYEMTLSPRDWPWEGCSNVFVDLIPNKTDTFVSRIAQQVFQPREYLARGLTSEAQQWQSTVERYYNAELWRHNWIEPHYQYLHLGARDGTAIMEVLWKKETRIIKTNVDMPQVDDQGMQLMDEDGNLQTKRTLHKQEITVYDDVWLDAVELRDFLMFPAFSRSIDDAYFVGRAHYFNNNELKARAASGQFYKEAVDFIIKKVGPQDELAADTQETDTLSAGGNINVADDSTRQPEIGEEISTFKIWRLHCSAFDLDNDGENEENVFWVHESTGKLMGAEPFKYNHGKRPFVPLALMPRPNRFYGYGVPERLAPSQEQLNSIRNHRNDQLDLIESPPMYQTQGVRQLSEVPWGPGAKYELSDPKDLGILALPQTNPQSYTEEQLIFHEADTTLGLEAPMPTQGGRQTKAQMQMASALMGVRLQLVAKRMLFAMREILWHIHELKKQFGPDVDRVPTQAQGKPVTLEVPKSILELDYDLDVNGLINPIEATSRRQEKMFLYSLLMQNPLVQGHMDRVYYVTRDTIEDFDTADVEAMIGTAEQAQQQQQQMQQQAQQQKQLEALGLINHIHTQAQHGNGPTAPPKGAPKGKHGAPPPTPPASV